VAGPDQLERLAFLFITAAQQTVGGLL